MCPHLLAPCDVSLIYDSVALDADTLAPDRSSQRLPRAMRRTRKYQSTSTRCCTRSYCCFAAIGGVCCSAAQQHTRQSCGGGCITRAAVQHLTDEQWKKRWRKAIIISHAICWCRYYSGKKQINRLRWVAKTSYLGILQFEFHHLLRLPGQFRYFVFYHLYAVRTV